MSNVRPESMQRINNEELANAFIAEQTKALKEQIGDNKVLLALSGGVDSSVTAALLIRAIGKQLTCVHVNHGLLRKGEPEQVIEVFRNQMDANLIYVDATDRFLDALAGVDDPEKKRKIIGKIFIDVFAEEAKKLDDIKFLAQGTIYPDILESVGVKFDDILIDRSFESDPLPTRKPGVAMMQKYIDDKDNFSLEESLVIGDRETDVILAKNLGCKAVFLGGKLSEDLEKYCLIKAKNWTEAERAIISYNNVIKIKRDTKETKIDLKLSKC